MNSLCTGNQEKASKFITPACGQFSFLSWHFAEWWLRIVMLPVIKTEYTPYRLLPKTFPLKYPATQGVGIFAFRDIPPYLWKRKNAENILYFDRCFKKESFPCTQQQVSWRIRHCCIGEGRLHDSMAVLTRSCLVCTLLRLFTVFSVCVCFTSTFKSKLLWWEKGPWNNLIKDLLWRAGAKSFSETQRNLFSLVIFVFFCGSETRIPALSATPDQPDQQVGIEVGLALITPLTSHKT